MNRTLAQIYHDDDTLYDIAMDEKMERQLEDMKDACHEELLHNNLEYAIDHLGLPEVMTTLENVSIQLSKYGHEICVKQLINRLEEM